jgi:hypothetical protein
MEDFMNSASKSAEVKKPEIGNIPLFANNENNKTKRVEFYAP